MPSFRDSRTFAGKTAERCFAAALEALPEAGFSVWKSRPLAWFVIANKANAEREVRANLAARPGRDAVVTLSLSSNSGSEGDLAAIAREIMAVIEAKLA